MPIVLAWGKLGSERAGIIVILFCLPWARGWGGGVFKWQIVYGAPRSRGELGLISIETEGYPCNSGNRGSLEQHASAQTLRREMNLTGLELAQLAAKGDAEAIAYWEKFGQRLGMGIANLVYVLTPEAVIIGGGLSASSSYFFPPWHRKLRKGCYYLPVGV
ncbi:ROK family protein [Synechocystis sp. B12]|nr:ROK family protein [Synechocystis sp. B12]